MTKLAVFLLALSLLPMAKSEVLGKFCGPSPTVYGKSADSTYHANLKLLSVTLTNNASSAPFLFANGSVTSAWGTLYGLALCRGDATASVCSDCLGSTFGSAQQLCGYSMDVAVFDDMCLIRVADGDFTDTDDYQQITNGVTIPTTYVTTTTNTSMPPLPGWDPGSAASITKVIRVLLQETSQTAAYYSKRMYVTGFMDATSTMPPLYSMAQCTPDLAQVECLTCLQYITEVAMGNFTGQQAGRVLALRCSLGYDTTLFYSGMPMRRITPPTEVAEPAAVPNLKHKKHVSKILVIALVIIPLLAWLFGMVILFKFTRRHRKGKVSEDNVKLKLREDEELVWGLEGRNSEFMVYDFAQIIEATGNFSERNKLGKGGFGPVYKGRFPDGLEIAVKRLAARSVQGFTEFKNEIQLIAKLQHTNLVRLLGCCTHGEEKILIYEYLPNKSLDFFIFDPARKYIVNWKKRLVIIEGVAQGLLYLHKHSRLRVIHRDLKASNILLDGKMNPKISDFGLAKIFGTNESEGNTGRIAGTYGYMAPEYASEGIFSIKSDVFSFGVLLLEIVSGKRTSSFQRYGDFINLLGHAWQLWKDGLWLQLVDGSIDAECYTLEVMRCINIALLCVQENAADRPTMSDVVAMLSSESLILPEPKHPAYFHVRVTQEEASMILVPASLNDVTVSALDGR